MDRAEKERILSELMGMSEDVYDQLVNMLCSQMHSQLEQMLDAVKTTNYDSVRRIAHSIGGCAGNLRLTAIYQRAREIEDTAGISSGADYVMNSIQELEILLGDLESGL
ncbi:MAG: Hpt domain-containing protein [Candidatus Auribacterota bacterium]|jgi:HPt (histidine-containing phosphotransfer) domain-containing protein|uniref:Hpt domain-containing protein n=1 Tax=Candidatus Auribacter fodinae TaxID=2093366 RepID=A0A3A4R5L0_9BACT|nr:MAG: Hpt domain-containing protein [Candidatus Auribacter fodinae]